MGTIQVFGRDVMPTPKPQVVNVTSKITVKPIPTPSPVPVMPQKKVLPPSYTVEDIIHGKYPVPTPEPPKITVMGKTVMPSLYQQKITVKGKEITTPMHVVVAPTRYQIPKGYEVLPSKPVPVEYEIERQSQKIQEISKQIQQLETEKQQQIKRVVESIHNIEQSPMPYVIINEKPVPKSEAIKYYKQELKNITTKYDEAIQSLEKGKVDLTSYIQELQKIKETEIVPKPPEDYGMPESPKYTHIVYSPSGEVKGFTAPVKALEEYSQKLKHWKYGSFEEPGTYKYWLAEQQAKKLREEQRKHPILSFGRYLGETLFAHPEQMGYKTLIDISAETYKRYPVAYPMLSFLPGGTFPLIVKVASTPEMRQRTFHRRAWYSLELEKIAEGMRRPAFHFSKIYQFRIPSTKIRIPFYAPLPDVEGLKARFYVATSPVAMSALSFGLGGVAGSSARTVTRLTMWQKIKSALGLGAGAFLTGLYVGEPVLLHKKKDWKEFASRLAFTTQLFALGYAGYKLTAPKRPPAKITQKKITPDYMVTKRHIGDYAVLTKEQYKALLKSGKLPKKYILLESEAIEKPVKIKDIWFRGTQSTRERGKIFAHMYPEKPEGVNIYFTPEDVYMQGKAFEIGEASFFKRGVEKPFGDIYVKIKGRYGTVHGSSDFFEHGQRIFLVEKSPIEIPYPVTIGYSVAKQTLYAVRPMVIERGRATRVMRLTQEPFIGKEEPLWYLVQRTSWKPEYMLKKPIFYETTRPPFWFGEELRQPVPVYAGDRPLFSGESFFYAQSPIDDILRQISSTPFRVKLATYRDVKYLMRHMESYPFMEYRSLPEIRESILPQRFIEIKHIHSQLHPEIRYLSIMETYKYPTGRFSSQRWLRFVTGSERRYELLKRFWAKSAYSGRQYYSEIGRGYDLGKIFKPRGGFDEPVFVKSPSSKISTYGGVYSPYSKITDTSKQIGQSISSSVESSSTSFSSSTQLLSQEIAQMSKSVASLSKVYVPYVPPVYYPRIFPLTTYAFLTPKLMPPSTSYARQYPSIYQPSLQFTSASLPTYQKPLPLISYPVPQTQIPHYKSYTPSLYYSPSAITQMAKPYYKFGGKEEVQLRRSKVDEEETEFRRKEKVREPVLESAEYLPLSYVPLRYSMMPHLVKPLSRYLSYRIYIPYYGYYTDSRFPLLWFSSAPELEVPTERYREKEKYNKKPYYPRIQLPQSILKPVTGIITKPVRVLEPIDILKPIWTPIIYEPVKPDVVQTQKVDVIPPPYIYTPVPDITIPPPPDINVPYPYRPEITLPKIPKLPKLPKKKKKKPRKKKPLYTYVPPRYRKFNIGFITEVEQISKNITSFVSQMDKIFKNLGDIYKRRT